MNDMTPLPRHRQKPITIRSDEAARLLKKITRDGRSQAQVIEDALKREDAAQPRLSREEFIAKVWQFRPTGKRMWDQTVLTDPGSASVTINANEISGSFVIGPYNDPKGQAWTVRGTFECSRLMKTGSGL